MGPVVLRRSPPPITPPSPHIIINTGCNGTACTVTVQQANAAASPGSRLNLLNGNLTLQMGIVGGGSFDPTAVYTYNSQSTDQTPAGFGWSGQYDRLVEPQDESTAFLSKGTGAVLVYTDKDLSTGVYQAPVGGNALVQNSDGSWTETQPNGFLFNYDTTGTLATMQSTAGSVWTRDLRRLQPGRGDRRPGRRAHQLQLRRQQPAPPRSPTRPAGSPPSSSMAAATWSRRSAPSSASPICATTGATA